MSSQTQSNAPRVVIWFLVLAALVVGAVVYTRVEPPAAAVKIALVTADSDPFWDAVVEGAEATADEMGFELAVFRSSGDMQDQNKLLSDVAAGGFSGVAVSPVDGTRQALALREMSEAMPVVTLDSDSELSGRLCFVGPDNYSAGRRCGQMLREAKPDGAKVVIICGPIEKENGRLRRQGFVDELLGRSYGPGRPMDALDAELSTDTYSVLATYVDPIDPEQAKANIAMALEQHPDADTIVGLYAYHVPTAMAALDEAGKLDSMTVIGFDDRQETLAGIADGRVFGTIAQDQYSYGRASVRLLADVAQAEGGDGSVAVPIRGNINFPPIMVKRDSLDQFMSERGRARALMGVRVSEDG
ncbi:MAG: substrate-binding domain-containing protein [Planctomycetota bacterium]